MRSFKRRFIQCLCALLVFVGVVSCFSILLLKVDGTTFLTMYDYEREEQQIDLLFVGNSLCRSDINPYIIDENLGVNSFNLSKESVKLEGLRYLLQSQLPKKKIDKVVLVIDPVQLIEPEEDTVVLAALVPYIRNPFNMLQYSFDTTIKYGSFLDRFFPWRMFYEDHPGKMIDNLKYKLSKEYCYEEKLRLYNTSGEGSYDGKGYGNHNIKIDETSIQLAKQEHIEITVDGNAFTQFKGKFNAIIEVCRNNGCEIIVIVPPHMRDIVINNPNYKISFEMIQSACDEIGIDCLNFCFAREEFLPQELESDYYDAKCHLNGTGADMFSEFLSIVLLDYYAGHGVEKYFYSLTEYYN